MVSCSGLAIIHLCSCDFPLDLSADSINLLFRDRAIHLEIAPVVFPGLFLNRSALSL